jgi:hypothetical protein
MYLSINSSGYNQQIYGDAIRWRDESGTLHDLPHTSFISNKCYTLTFSIDDACWIAEGIYELNAANISGVLPTTKGGTGVTSLEELRSELGIGSSSGGGTYGCVREFVQDNLPSITREVYYDGYQSKFYTVTVGATAAGVENGIQYRHTFTVEYRTIETIATHYCGPTFPGYTTPVTLTVIKKSGSNTGHSELSDGSPIFSIPVDGGFTILCVCGYI